MTPRVRVKVCGVTTPTDAVAAVDAGADFLGLNFHPPSPRFLSPERAAEIVAAVAGRATLVGVFVDRPAAEVTALRERLGLDLVQLHGDETPDAVRELAPWAIKAIRVDGAVTAADVAGWESFWGLLVDARHPELYGGSGRRWAVASLAELRGAGVLPRRVLVAGGVEPENVAATVRAARPWGVDVCSGVESAPGRKDLRRLRRLFEEIRDVETTTSAA